MIKTLKVVLIAYGAIHIVLGLSLIFAPQQTAGLMGFAGLDNPALYIAALCGLTFIAASVWIIAAARDPVQNIAWVKFAILWAVLGAIVQLYLLSQGVVNFSQAGLGIIQDIVFAAALLASYPYRAIRAA